MEALQVNVNHESVGINDVVDNFMVLCVKKVVFRCLTLAVYTFLSFLKLKVR